MATPIVTSIAGRKDFHVGPAAVSLVIALLICGCRDASKAPIAADLSHPKAVRWDVEDLREEGKHDVYIMNEVTNGTSKVLTNITCETAAKPRVELVADQKWSSRKIAVLITFDQDPTGITQIWSADNVRAKAPDPVALLKSFLAHDLVQISFPSPDGISKKFILDVDRSSTSLAPVAAFCGLGGISNPVSLRMIEIRGRSVSRLMTSDEVFTILHPSDEVGKPKAQTDEHTPNSLVVTHTYVVSGERFSISFRRMQSNGPYRVSDIWELPRK